MRREAACLDRGLTFREHILYNILKYLPVRPIQGTAIASPLSFDTNGRIPYQKNHTP